MKLDNSPARGTRDLLPSAVALRDHVFSTIADVYRRYGYQRIETPALEDISRLRGGQGGENEKLIYQVLRRGLPEVIEAGTPLPELVDLGLRFDLTVPLTRFYGNNHASLPLPFRSFQFGPVWRAERPQKGRYRQFNQCDIDLIGDPSVLAEVEQIEATTEALSAIGLSGAAIRLSDRRFLSALAQTAQLPEQTWPTFFIALDKLDKIGWNGVRAELAERGLPEQAVSTALTLIEGLVDLSGDKVIDAISNALSGLDEKVLDDLHTTVSCLDRLPDTRELRWQFDPTLVRGMGYYTGQIFEISHPQSQSSIGGGGRYDKLIGHRTGKDVPACGFSIGFERILDLLSEAPRTKATAVLFESDVPLSQALEAARDLRADGQIAVVLPRSGKLGSQLARLTATGFMSVVHLRADANEPEELRFDR